MGKHKSDGVTYAVGPYKCKHCEGRFETKEELDEECEKNE